MNIRKSAEDYLEQILMIREQKGVVRSIDIAAGLNVTKPSVSVAMKRLRENGYISMDACCWWAWTRSTPGRTPARWSMTSARCPMRRW